MKGVGQINLGGSRKPAIRIQIDPRKAAALGLQLDQIRATLATSTVNAPKGQLIGSQQTLTVYTDDQLLDAKTWNDVIVGYRNGAPIRVSDLGGAILSVENTQGGAWSEVGKGATTRPFSPGLRFTSSCSSSRAQTSSTLSTRSKPPCPNCARPCLQGIDMNVIADRTLTIRASVREVKLTLMITIVLVVFVIFLFPRVT